MIGEQQYPRCAVCDQFIMPQHCAHWQFVSHGFVMDLCHEDSIPVMREARSAAEREVKARRALYGRPVNGP